MKRLDRRRFLQRMGSLGAGFALGVGGRPAFAGRSERGYGYLLQGPMLGPRGATQARVWCRASGERALQLEYGRDPELRDARRTEPIEARREEDLVSVLTVDDLEPGARYYYRVLVDERPPRYLEGLPPSPLRTAPAERSRFRVAFGSCARLQESNEQPIWDAVARWRPDLFCWLGDNIYADSLVPSVLAETYRAQRSVPKLQPVLRGTPQLAIWDDHDYGLNDHDRTSPLRDTALAAFRRYWANPAYGLPESPGVFFRYAYGGVDFFFLDCRYYRDPNAAPDEPGKTMLGAAQLEWLTESLRASDAPFKVLASGSGWTRAKGPQGDSWAAFLHERERLFEFLRKHGIGGVVLLSGDTHCGELNAVPRSEEGGYDLYDLVSSPLAQPPSATWIVRQPEIRLRAPYTGSPNFGVLDFDLTAEPTLRFQLVDTRGRAVWAPLTLRAAELTNGTRSWPDKVDDAVDRLPDGALSPRQAGRSTRA